MGEPSPLVRSVSLLVASIVLAFPAASQHLIGTVSSGGFVQLADLNPTTGVASLLAGTLTDASSIDGQTSYDPTGNRYFFLGTPSGGSLSIYVVSIGGMSFTKAAISGSGFTNIFDIEYDALNGTLYALVFTSGTLQMATVNTSTGAVTLLGSPLGAGLSYSGQSRLDPTASGAFPSGRFYFRGDPNVYGVNVATTAIYRQAAQPALPLVGLQAGGGGLYLLQLNGSDGRLLSLATSDTATFGTSTPGSNLTGGTFSATGRETFDISGNRYYLIGSASSINAGATSVFAIDAATLALAGNAVLSGQTAIQNLELDPGTVPVVLQTFEVD